MRKCIKQKSQFCAWYYEIFSLQDFGPSRSILWRFFSTIYVDNMKFRTFKTMQYGTISEKDTFAFAKDDHLKVRLVPMEAKGEKVIRGKEEGCLVLTSQHD